MIYTFYGHRNTSESIRVRLKAVLEEALNDDNCLFYIGNEGNFDRMVIRELQSLSMRFSHIKYYVVLAKPEHDLLPERTIYLGGIELVPPKFRIDYRNKWMLDKADTVITYVIRPGGASKYRDMAIKKGKRILDLTENLHL